MFFQSVINESEEFASAVSDDIELYEMADCAINDFRHKLNHFVTSNFDTFLGESIDSTYKNIKVFSEVATSQYISEVNAVCNFLASEESELETVNEAVSEYF